MIDEIRTLVTIATLLQKSTSGLKFIYNSIRGWIYWIAMNRTIDPGDNYSVVQLDEGRFSEFVGLRHDFFFESTGMTLDTFKERYERSPQAFKCVIKKDAETNTTSLVGYYIILPITKKCVQNIDNGFITVGRNIRIDDIAKNFSQGVASVYISAVCGKTLLDQIKTTRFLQDELISISKRKKIDRMFVRPTTWEGRMGFKSLIGKKCNTEGKIESFNLNSEETKRSLMERKQKEEKFYIKKAKQNRIDLGFSFQM